MREELTISTSFYLVPNLGEHFTGGEIYHRSRHLLGGSTSTPIGRAFVTMPEIGAEGFHPHTRIDCVLKERPLCPEPAHLARNLAVALKSAGLVGEPIWLGWWQAKELGGEAQGEVFDLD